jgi:nucleoside-diphosphate-sugar epimerase
VSERRKKMSGGRGEEKVVCVTGASGYIASWIVKLLLERGYTVKATVRDPNDPKKTQHLRSLDGANERLHLFKADLLEQAVFDSVVDGCQAVFHTASPVVLSSTNPQAEIVDPAVKGTLNVLRSCAKTSSIRRVVLTSSMAAVAYNGKPLTSDVVVDETWFSDPNFCEESMLWYMLSKTLAEEAAWKFCKENGIDLVTINPGYVIGPLLQPSLNLTVSSIFKLVNGEYETLMKENESFSSGVYRFVDVRDVAYAHIQAYETPSASGRYCIVGIVTNVSEAVEILRTLYPSLPLPEISTGVPPPPLYQISKEKAKGLGVNFTPLEITLKDTIESLKEKGFLSNI